jgi:copper chaperone CopZ
MKQEAGQMAQGLTERVIFTSSKITATGDVDRLEDGLSARDGVRDVNVDPGAHTVEVVFDPTVVNAPAIQSEVEDLGYKIDTVKQQER